MLIVDGVVGNLEEFFSRDGCAFQDRIAEAYGPVVKINGLLGVRTCISISGIHA